MNLWTNSLAVASILRLEKAILRVLDIKNESLQLIRATTMKTRLVKYVKSSGGKAKHFKLEVQFFVNAFTWFIGDSITGVRATFERHWETRSMEKIQVYCLIMVLISFASSDETAQVSLNVDYCSPSLFFLFTKILN